MELPLGTVVLYYLAVFWKHAVPLLFSTFKVDRNLSIHVPALSGIGEMFIFISFGFLSHSLKNKTKKQNPGHALKNSPASNIIIKKRAFYTYGI